MSRTFRTQPADGNHWLDRWHTAPQPYMETARDGKQSFARAISRDNRATGLRREDHRRARSSTRHCLKHDDPELAQAGKMRRYTDCYGRYAW